MLNYLGSIDRSAKRKKILAPAQHECGLDIGDVNGEIAALVEQSRQPFVDQKKIKDRIGELQDEKKRLQSRLRRLQSGAASSKRHREKRRIQLETYQKEHPDDKSCLVKEKVGRPSIEKYYPGFSAVLMDIVNQFCATGHQHISHLYPIISI